MIPVSTQYLSIEQTGAFSAIVNDYVNGEEALRPFYRHEANIAGIKAAIAERKKFPTDRKALAELLQDQYQGKTLGEPLSRNLALLQQENTFTITTAHQPNIFTGHLYFIYKILHCIRLANELRTTLPDYNFVPVFYMGSEDADLDELGEVVIDNHPYRWDTPQQGAVGRMNVDKPFLATMEAITAQVGVLPFGAEIMRLMKEAYLPGISIEQATFSLVHALFHSYGLVILLPDIRKVKAAFSAIMHSELFTGFSHAAVVKTVEAFPPQYKVQAAGREINLFYLFEQSRERIIKTDDGFAAGDRQFSAEEISAELKNFPERFSPNVILRPVLQEYILPNIAFIGGGGELAYWLELEAVFAAKSVPFPVLLLRNSFMLMEPQAKRLAEKLELDTVSLFLTEEILLQQIVQRSSDKKLSLQAQQDALATVYNEVRSLAAAVDITLEKHVQALEKQAADKLLKLQQKMLRAEKRKFAAEERQLHTLKASLFPANNLQERVENIIPFYGRFGPGIFELLYNASPALQAKFTVLALAAAK